MNLSRIRAYPSMLLFVAAVLSVTVYLAFSSYYFRVGFPLDDAWIHQTYARNLVEQGSWTYTENTGAGGSTSPLWTVMLSLGYILSIPPKLWAYLLGAITLFCTALAAMRWFERSTGVTDSSATGLALLIGFEWHLVWAAVSGMETLFLGLLTVGFFLVLQNDSRRYLIAGLLIGIGMWIRPDAILLILPGLWILMFQPKQSSLHSRMLMALQLIAGIALFVIPYLIFNYFTAGSIWPRTFFAKQAEYQALLEVPWIVRLLPMLRAPLVGVGILLLPGFFFHLYDSIRNRLMTQIAPFIWVGCYFGAYALRLPVTYQHGRYLMPLLPVSIVLGYTGLRKLLRMNSAKPLSRIVLRVWNLSIPAVLIAFWVVGARAYAQDVAIIESEMVDTARWIQANTPSGAKIAAHDIGAIGYYAERQLLDLAGLVSPEVIPIIRDELALEMMMNGEDVDYLMTFPGWYPYLTSVGEKVYDTGSPFGPAQGGENMTVYRWP